MDEENFHDIKVILLILINKFLSKNCKFYKQILSFICKEPLSRSAIYHQGIFSIWMKSCTFNSTLPYNLVRV